jgi:uncharacterized 2Fe-2S/4Fe-4S cluster protein (DUF4445 family)
LNQAGVVRHDGNLLRDHPLVKTHGDQTAFVLARPERSDAGDIVITQRDIRAIQLGKGAIRAGIEVLLRESDCPQEEIEDVIIAGAFGSYIDLASARAIGMFPDLPAARFKQVGNAAGMGARMSLISKSKRREATGVAQSVKYINLSDYPDFTRIFTGALNFPILHSSA